jgi:Xaa-Pro dipeptidase
VDKSSLFPILADLRVYKTEAELRVMRYVSEVTSAAHVEVMRQAQPGWYEVSV